MTLAAIALWRSPLNSPNTIDASHNRFALIKKNEWSAVKPWEHPWHDKHRFWENRIFKKSEIQKKYSKGTFLMKNQCKMMTTPNIFQTSQNFPVEKFQGKELRAFWPPAKSYWPLAMGPVPLKRGESLVYNALFDIRRDPLEKKVGPIEIVSKKYQFVHKNVCGIQDILPSLGGRLTCHARWTKQTVKCWKPLKKSLWLEKQLFRWSGLPIFIFSLNIV